MNKTEIEQQLSEISLPEVTMDKHSAISKKKMSPLRNTPFIGIIIITLLGMMANVGVSKLKLFMDIPSLIYVTLIPFSLITISYGLGGLKMVFTAPFEMRATGEIRDAYITILKDLKIYAIVSGWLGAIIGLILVVNDGELLTRTRVDFLPIVGVGMMTVLYGYFIAYFYAYPLQKRFEHNN